MVGPACVTVVQLWAITADVLGDPEDPVDAEGTLDAVSEGLLFEKLPEEGVTDV